MSNEFWNANWQPRRGISNPKLPLFLDGQKTTKLAEAECRKITDFLVLEKEIHAFTEDQNRDSWLQKNKQVQSNYEYVSKGVSDVQQKFKQMDQQNREKILDPYVKRLRIQNEFVHMLHDQDAEQNIQVPSLFKAASSWWPEGAYLYKHCGFGGYWIYLPLNSTIPHLSFLGLNDAISSVILVRHSTPFSCSLYEHGWYQGRRVTIVAGSPGTTTQVRCLKGYPYYFNDKASSVIVSNWWSG